MIASDNMSCIVKYVSYQQIELSGNYPGKPNVSGLPLVKMMTNESLSLPYRSLVHVLSSIYSFIHDDPIPIWATDGYDIFNYDGYF